MQAKLIRHRYTKFHKPTQGSTCTEMAGQQFKIQVTGVSLTNTHTHTHTHTHTQTNKPCLQLGLLVFLIIPATIFLPVDKTMGASHFLSLQAVLSLTRVHQ